MRRLAFLLHIYQPPLQHEDVFREVASQCYLPLIKLMKEKKIRLTLSAPLSLLEQMDQYGYKEWLDDVKDLVENERIELVGSAAYHPLLTEIPLDYAEKQIILNEFGLGYYFGKRGGFDGDPSIMIQNLRGFYPPEFSVNDDVLRIVNDLGYEWMVVDEVGELNLGLYKVNEFDTRVVVRNSKLSVMLESNKSLKVNTFVEEFTKGDSCVLALKGESFGYDRKEGIMLLGDLLGALKKADVKVGAVSDYVETKDEKELDTLGKSKSEHTKDSKVYQEVLNKILDVYKPNIDEKLLVGFEEVPIWKSEELAKIEDEQLKEALLLDLLVSKAASSDGYSHEETNSLISEILEKLNDDKLTKYVSPRLEKLKDLRAN